MVEWLTQGIQACKCLDEYPDLSGASDCALNPYTTAFQLNNTKNIKAFYKL